MLNKTIAATAFALSIAAPFAGAYSLVSNEVIKGTIEKVDAQSNAVVIEKSNGREELVAFSDNANLYIDGQASEVADLKTGQAVKISRKTLTKVEDKLVGEIVSVSRAKMTAKIRLSSDEIVNVQFGDKVSVSGMSVDSFSKLRPGHQVVVRYAAN